MANQAIACVHNECLAPIADVYQEVARRIPLEMLGELGTRRPKLGS